MAKLTLSIDQKIIDAAKAYAQRHNTSLSKLVAGFLMELSHGPQDDFFVKLHEELLREGFQAPKDDLHELRRRHVARRNVADFTASPIPAKTPADILADL